ncbi:MAG TPA: sigma-70 family RNA polymerase sigma factor, partial [Gemmatimonadaceae bacterium]
MEGSSDAVVVARVLRGDVEVFRVLVERYRDRFARYAYHMLGNREDAEEALQDAFTRAYRSLARCEDPERFSAWLFRILVNRCRTMGARRGRRAKTFVVD